MVELDDDEEGAETEAQRHAGAAGRQSSKKRRANTVPCWKHYSQPFKHSDGNRYVKCKLCEHAFNLKFSGGTSNMIKHLRERHKLPTRKTWCLARWFGSERSLRMPPLFTMRCARFCVSFSRFF